MQEYTVDHNGSIRANDASEKNPDGTLYTYHAGKPVYLPDEVAKALGESAKPTGKKQENKEQKDVQNPLNKMVGAGDTKTK